MFNESIIDEPRATTLYGLAAVAAFMPLFVILAVSLGGYAEGLNLMLLVMAAAGSGGAAVGLGLVWLNNRRRGHSPPKWLCPFYLVVVLGSLIIAIEQIA